MKKIKRAIAGKVGLPDGRLIPGVYTNGFVSFTIMNIRKDIVLLYANADIPFMNISEDDALEIPLDELNGMFNDLLSDFRIKHAE